MERKMNNYIDRTNSFKPKDNDPYYRELYKLLKKSVNPREDKNILVMGCHVGRDVDVLLYQNPTVRITILEPVKSFYDEYNKKRRSNELWRGHVTVVHAPWEEQYPFSRRFDAVTCLDCIEHSPDPDGIMNALSEYSNKIILSCPNGIWNRMMGSRDKQWVEDHGHGPHIQLFSFGDIYRMFDKIDYYVSATPVRFRWLGWFGFGIFAVGGLEIQLFLTEDVK